MEATEFDTLFQQNRERLINYCQRLVSSREDAEDAAGDTYQRARKSLSSFRGEARPFTWLCQIAHNACIDLVRRRKPHLSLNDPMNAGIADQPDPDPTPEQSVLGKSLITTILAEAQTRKPPWDKTDYTIFLLYYREQWTTEKISEVLQMNHSTVRSRFRAHIHPVLKQIKETLCV